MKHDKNLVVKKDIQVFFYKILLFALLLHIYIYISICNLSNDLQTLYVLLHMTWNSYCNI